MSVLPTVAYLTNPARTVAETQQAFSDWLSFIAQRMGGAAESELTIASGAVTPTTGTHQVDTEGDAASDDLASIVTTNLSVGLLLIRPVHADRTVVVKHAAGGAGQVMLKGAADFSMDNTDKWLMLQRSGDDWVEVFRSYGTDKATARLDAGAVGQSFSEVFAVTGGSANAYTLTLSPAPAAYADGQVFFIETNHSNTDAATLNVNGLGAKAIQFRGAAIAAGTLVANRRYIGQYRAASNSVEIVSPHGLTPVLNAVQTFTKPQRPAVAASASVAGDVTLDLDVANDFPLTLTAAITITNPALSAPMVGQKGSIVITNPSVYALSGIGTYWKRSGGTGVPTLTANCRIDYHVVATDRIEYSFSAVEA